AQVGRWVGCIRDPGRRADAEDAIENGLFGWGAADLRVHWQLRVDRTACAPMDAGDVAGVDAAGHEPVFKCALTVGIGNGLIDLGRLLLGFCGRTSAKNAANQTGPTSD